MQLITTNTRRSFLAGVQALAPTIAGAARLGGNGKEGADDIGGKLYSENNIAALKGYCGVINPSGIPTIWDSFQLASHRHKLRVEMSKWSHRQGPLFHRADGEGYRET